jgi:ribosomal protein S18 acetylase RimI-like enzyme
MEYGGRSAFVDDLFVRPAARQRGVGRALVERARAICEALGIRAMHLEVARENAPAQALYRAVGFESTDRQLLTLGIAAATHEA